MFCAIRQYENCTDAVQLRIRVEKELLPVLRDMPGFQSYILIDCDDGDVTSFTAFATQADAENANIEVAKIAADSFADLLPDGTALAIVGEVMIHNRK